MVYLWKWYSHQDLICGISFNNRCSYNYVAVEGWAATASGSEVYIQ